MEQRPPHGSAIVDCHASPAATPDWLPAITKLAAVFGAGLGITIGLYAATILVTFSGWSPDAGTVPRPTGIDMALLYLVVVGGAAILGALLLSSPFLVLWSAWIVLRPGDTCRTWRMRCLRAGLALTLLTGWTGIVWALTRKHWH